MSVRNGTEYYENPSLYGLRRSARSHNPPDRIQEVEDDNPSKYTEYTSESDSDVPKKTRKWGKPKVRKAKEEEFYDQNGYRSKTPSEDENDEEDDDEIYASSKRSRLQELANSKRRKLQSNSEEESSGVYTPPMRFSSRSSKVVNYSIDNQDDDADLLETDDELANKYAEQHEPETPAGMYEDNPKCDTQSNNTRCH